MNDGVVPTTAAATRTADPFAAHDGIAEATPDSGPRPVMQAQVVLDRLGFTPGVIDGRLGLSTKNAVAGYQEANGMPVTGDLDDATRERLARWNTIPATRVVTIPADFAAGSFVPVPEDPASQAALPALGYASLDEKLAERFHTSVATLRELNPGGTPAGAGSDSSAAGAGVGGMPGPTQESVSTAAPAAGEAPPPPMFRAGQQVRVPNIGNDRIDAAMVKDNADWLTTLRTLGVGTGQPQVGRIVVSKSAGTLKGYDRGGKLVAVYTATMGSEHDPLPLGAWEIKGVARNPKFHYNPDLFWDADAGDQKAMLPPGPNSPVGVVWIDLSKPHYGIHGTPRPETIGRAESHGCLRLTNWDAARLAQMVRPGTDVLFEA
ncbi:MAG: L,D-transpeptidase family protein [Pseudomonadota bacterium]